MDGVILAACNSIRMIVSLYAHPVVLIFGAGGTKGITRTVQK